MFRKQHPSLDAVFFCLELRSRFFAAARAGAVCIFMLMIARFAGIWFGGICVHMVFI